TLSPGIPDSFSNAAKGLLAANNVALNNGTVAFRVATTLAGFEFDQLVANGSVSVDSTPGTGTKMALDLSELTSLGTVPLIVSTGAPGASITDLIDPSNVGLVNNPNGLIATVQLSPDSSELDVQFQDSPRTPTINWAPPADIILGTPLSNTQLNATAS